MRFVCITVQQVQQNILQELSGFAGACGCADDVRHGVCRKIVREIIRIFRPR